MTIDLKKANQVFIQSFSDKLDLYTNPDRSEELKVYLSDRDSIKLIKQIKTNNRNKEIAKLKPLPKGRYKIKCLTTITEYGTTLGKNGDVVTVFNNGNTWNGGSMNMNQDDRALNFDYGMGGADCYFPNIDFEIIEYLGV